MPSTDGVTNRYICKRCGGKTRFTVKFVRTVQYYHHQSLDGEMTPEEVEVLDERVLDVTCIYCGHGDGVEEVMEGPDTG